VNPFEHESLDVDPAALEFIVAASVVDELPRGRSDWVGY
jgi:hypothetical protein